MEIICPQCGWRNEPTARMCGGCGQPLHTPIAPPADPEAITDPDLRRATPFPGYAPPGGYADDVARTQPAILPEALPARTGVTKRDARARLARNVLLALLVLTIVGALAWASVIRPALHQRVDSLLRTILDTDAATVVAVQPGTYAITAASLNAYLAEHPIANSPLTDPQVHFTDGKAIVTFHLLGGQGSVSTVLYAVNGRFFATSTVVDGWLSLVESGDELQAAINEALSYLPASEHVQSSQAENDLLVVTLS
jgi:hypothetical protein